MFLFTNSNVIQRLDQFSLKGNSPELIDCLANDAQKWAELRSILKDQVREARKFVRAYCQRYNANNVPKDLDNLLTNELESEVSNRIGQLDQIVRDLLQIVSIMCNIPGIIPAHFRQEFAWASVTEARISTRLGKNVMLLTYVSIFYLPLAFCAASTSASFAIIPCRASALSAAC